MSRLRRTAAGIYTEEQSHTMDEILSSADPAALLLPTDSLFSAFAAVTLDAKQEALCRNGNPVPGQWSRETLRVYSPGGEFLALARGEGGRLRTIKSFFEVN